MGNYVFRGCTGLRAVILPTTLERIGRYAFSYCQKLETVNIPASVTEIDSEAFSYTGMWSVNFLGDAPTVASNAFRGTQTKAYYPTTAQGWTRKTAINYGGSLTWEAV